MEKQAIFHVLRAMHCTATQQVSVFCISRLPTKQKHAPGAYTHIYGWMLLTAAGVIKKGIQHRRYQKKLAPQQHTHNAVRGFSRHLPQCCMHSNRMQKWQHTHRVTRHIPTGKRRKSTHYLITTTLLLYWVLHPSHNRTHTPHKKHCSPYRVMLHIHTTCSTLYTPACLGLTS